MGTAKGRFLGLFLVLGVAGQDFGCLRRLVLVGFSWVRFVGFWDGAASLLVGCFVLFCCCVGVGVGCGCWVWMLLSFVANWMSGRNSCFSVKLARAMS